MKRECFSLRQFLDRSACADYERNASIGILEDGINQERKAVVEEALKLQGEIVGDEDAQTRMEGFIRSHLKRDWFLADIQFENQVMEEMFYQKRLAAIYKGKIKKAANVIFEVSIPENGFPLAGSLKGMVHAVLQEDDGCYKALIFRNGVSPYSRSARKLENRPEYAPENLMMYLGLYQVYGRSLRVELVYLKHEKDGIQQPFDIKKQIMPADYRDLEIEDIQKRFEKVLISHIKKKQSENDCEKCKFITLCKKERKEEKEEDAEKIKASVPRFTQTQQKVVDFDKGACAVYAVPGAGKTTVLVHRLCRLLKKGVNPGKILFVTFTNKAAQEIRDRVLNITGKSGEADLPDIYTYNGLGWQIIRDHPIYGQKKLLSPTDEKLLLLRCIDEVPKLTGYNYNYINGRFGLLNQLKRSFLALEVNERHEIEELNRTGHYAEQVKSLYARLACKIKEEGFITYDEQITLANRILMENPDVLKQYAFRWEYIMADEFQDSSQDNVDLLYRIAKAGESNIVVVGDADQSIYEWRNGSPKHLLQFGEKFHGAKKILMQDNFRSSEKILEASNLLIAQNENRIDISMQPHKSGNARPYRMRGADINSILTILQMLKQKKYAYGDVAILSRKNAPLEKCRQLLEKNGIGCVSPSDNLVKASFFYLTGDLLKLAEDLRSDMSFYRVFRALGCSLPPKENKDVSFYDNLIRSKILKPMDINNMESVLTYAVADQDRPGSELFQAASTVFKLLMAMKACKPEKYLDMIADVFGYSTGDPAYRALLTVVEQHEPMETLDDLRNHMNFMEQLGDETPVEYSVEPEKVNLMTAHGSKGKEFPAVIVLQCEDFHAVEEERRLMYVAMTRAKKVLFLLESPFETCELFDSIDSLLQTMSMTT